MNGSGFKSFHILYLGVLFVLSGQSQANVVPYQKGLNVTDLDPEIEERTQFFIENGTIDHVFYPHHEFPDFRIEYDLVATERLGIVNESSRFRASVGYIQPSDLDFTRTPEEIVWCIIGYRRVDTPVNRTTIVYTDRSVYVMQYIQDEKVKQRFSRRRVDHNIYRKDIQTDEVETIYALQINATLINP